MYYIIIFTSLFCQVFGSGDDAGAPPAVHESFYFSEKLKAFELRKEDSLSEEPTVIEFVGSEKFSHHSSRKGMRFKIDDFDNIWGKVRFHGKHQGEDYFELLEKSHQPIEYVVATDQIFIEYTQDTGEFKGSIKEVDIKEGCECAEIVEMAQNGSFVVFTIEQRIAKGCPPLACSWEPVNHLVERFVEIHYTSQLSPNDTLYIRVNNEDRELLKLNEKTNSTIRFRSKIDQSRIFFAATGNHNDSDSSFTMQITFDKNLMHQLSNIVPFIIYLSYLLLK